jgi:hypothetical protein
LVARAAGELAVLRLQNGVAYSNVVGTENALCEVDERWVRGRPVERRSGVREERGPVELREAVRVGEELVARREMVM